MHQRLQHFLVVEKVVQALHSAQLLVSLILSLVYTMDARISMTTTN